MANEGGLPTLMPVVAEVSVGVLRSVFDIPPGAEAPTASIVTDYFDSIIEYARRLSADFGVWARANLPPIAYENIVLVLAAGMLVLGLVLVLSGIRLRRSARLATGVLSAEPSAGRAEPAASSEGNVSRASNRARDDSPQFDEPDIALDPTRRARPSDLAQPMPETEIETTTSEQFPPQVPRAWLHFLDAKGTRVPIGATAVRIGRHPENEIILENRTVHRHHAILQMSESGTFTIIDLDTVNRVFVNHQASKSRELQEGDLVELGEVRFRFQLTP